MRPLTDDVPKAILPLAGKPLLQRTAEGLFQAGINDIAIGLGWFREAVKAASIDWPPGTTLVDVPDYERGPLETLVTTLSHTDPESFLVTPVDAILSSDDISNLIKAHTRGITIAVDFTSHTGSQVYTDSDGMLVGFEEPVRFFSQEGRSAMVFAAEAEFLERCRTALTQGHSRVIDVINQMIHEGGHVRSFPITHGFLDLDTIQDFLFANSHLLAEGAHEPVGHIFVPKGDVMETRQEIKTGTGVRLCKGVCLDGPVLLAPECDLGPDSRVGPDVYLDRRTRVGSCCHLARVVASGESIIPDGVQIAGAVVLRSKVHYGGESNSE